MLLASLFLAALAAPALAHPHDRELRAQYQRGDYLAAAAAAEAAASADDLAFAARAVLAHIMTHDADPDPQLVDRARRDAEGALALDAVHAEAKLQLAIALSLQSRAMDALDAWNAGLGERGRKLAGEVLAADPSNVYAHGFLAVWNVEVRRRGGSIGATFMGASVGEGRRHYAEAARLSPDDIGVHWQWARALAALDARRYSAEVRAALDKALAAQVDDHVEEVMQARARRLSEALASGARTAQQLARSLL